MCHRNFCSECTTNRKVHMNRDIVVIIFARRPRVGHVKTRLAKTIGSRLATKIYSILLKRTLQQIAKVKYVRKILMPSNVEDVKWFRSKYSCSGWLIRPQARGSLGERMSRAINFELSKGRAVILVGSDVVTGQLQDIEKTRDLLNQGMDAVIGPALDGGYWLIGMRSKFSNIFQGIKWGQSTVCDATVEKLKEENCHFILLPPRQDLDRAQDLLQFKWRGYNQGRYSS